MYVTGCTAWTKAMRAENINPMQQVFTICIGNSTYHNSEREDADYMMGVSAWDPSMQIIDAVFGMTAGEFSQH